MKLLEQDKLIECFTPEYPFDKDRSELLEKHINSKDENEIMEYLLSINLEETGGQTAISGFFYQFLVTIQYFIELLDGKWDFVAFELHDDIVVGNEKEKKIRFIQVKTSKFSMQNPSSVSELYLGSLKKNKQKQIEVRVKDSWVDKLISKAQYFPSKEGYKTQFQLYTSYHVVKTNDYNFDHYTSNNNFYKKIENNDSLVKAIRKNTHNSKFDEVDYKKLCGESDIELLSRFQIKTGHYMVDNNSFINDIIVELSKRVFKDFGHQNIKLDINDILRLIGMICYRCHINGDISYLKVTKDELENILNEIREQCLKNIEEISEEHGNKKVLERVFTAFLERHENVYQYGFLEDNTFKYKTYLLKWINENSSIRDLFNRYIEGTNRTQTYYKTNSLNRETILKDLITILVYINIINNEDLEFADTEYFLSKKLTRDEKLKIFSFLNTIKPNTLDEYKKKLNLIMENADECEHLYLLGKELKVIVQNCRGKFKEAIKYPLMTRIDADNIQGLDDGPDINKVAIPAVMIPGKELVEEMYDILDLDDAEEFRNEIQRLCNTIG